MNEATDYQPLALVIDDNPMTRLMLRETLQQTGLRVEEAENGAVGLSLFHRLSPDIVLLDVVMPEMDGFTTCVELRKAPNGAHTPIVMLTGLDDEESIDHAYEVGATDFIAKPINWAILGHRLRYILRASRAFNELAMSQSQLAKAQRLAQLGSWSWDLMTNRVRRSDEVYRIFGLPPGQFAPTYEGFLSTVHPEDREIVERSVVAALKGEKPYSLDFRIVRPDGEVRYVHEQAEVECDASGKPLFMHGTVQDITERQQAEQTRARLIAIIEATTDLVSFADREGRALYVNKAGSEMLGLRPEEVTRRSIYEFSPAWAGRLIQTEGIPSAIQHGTWHSETALLHRDGHEIPVSQIILAHKTPDARVDFLSTIARDISERKAYEARLERQANYDELTRLPNRNLLQDRLSRALIRARRSGHGVAVLFLDLDRFKMVNDSLGHDAGDALLQAVAGRLRTCVRAEDTVARLGGDEFVLVLEDIVQDAAVETVADKVLAAIQAPFTLQEQSFTVNASIGISLFPRHGEDVQALLKNADTALHRAKDQGRGCVRFFTAEMNELAVERLALEQGLAQALKRGEFRLRYQPQVELCSGRIIGAEALLAWQHPTLGMVPPAKFIPLAEEAGLMVPIGEWVLKTACAQARAWQAAGLPPLTVAVNLSARQFIQADLPSRVAAILKETGLPPARLELEITETQLMQDVAGAIDTLRGFRAMGIRLAIDDFGTGYSSLNYLKRFPIDRLKIDRSFVRDIATDPNDAAIAVSVIAMAHSLKLGVIAEGVETRAQLAFLRAKGCDEIQGYCFSPPLAAEAMTALLQDDRRLPLEPAQEGELHTLLLVDDETNVTHSLKRGLHGEGYHVLTACSAKEALESLARHPVGVVVSDHRMPGMSGIEFLARVRELYPQTVRILLSGHYDTTTLAEAINSGAIHKFVSKPVVSEELRRTLREAFRLHQGQGRIGASTHPCPMPLPETAACALQP